MIELDQTSEYYGKEFKRFVNPPTHAKIVGMRWALLDEKLSFEGGAYDVMLRPHIEAFYVYGRCNAEGAFVQDPEDKRHKPVHAGLDMTEYDTNPRVGKNGEDLDDNDRKQILADWNRRKAIRDTLVAPYEGPSPEDPTQRVPSTHPQNRFSEHDLDIVFGNTDAHLYGKAV